MTSFAVEILKLQEIHYYVFLKLLASVVFEKIEIEDMVGPLGRHFLGRGAKF